MAEVLTFMGEPQDWHCRICQSLGDGEEDIKRRRGEPGSAYMCRVRRNGKL